MIPCMRLALPAALALAAAASAQPALTVYNQGFAVVRERVPLDLRAGETAFAFSGVAAGDYLLVAGTDRDNDDFLGDAGELFGAWPDLDDPRAITIVRGVNSTDLEFGMQDLVTVTSASAGGVRGREIRRLW